MIRIYPKRLCILENWSFLIRQEHQEDVLLKDTPITDEGWIQNLRSSSSIHNIILKRYYWGFMQQLITIWKS